MEGITTPIVDLKELQQKANEAATKAALKEIDDFYNGYDSPYKKAIREYLNNKSVDMSFSVPDIIVAINEELTIEVDRIANTAIANTFLPLIKNILTRADAEVKFSKILEKYIEEFYDSDDHDPDDFSVEKTREERSFSTYTISSPGKQYDINIYNKAEGVNEIYTLPWKTGREGYNDKHTMKLSIDGCATLEMPFTKNILHDPSLCYIATMVMANSNIVFDVKDFDYDMFPNNHCHCD
jgi:hypothetical protein